MERDVEDVREQAAPKPGLGPGRTNELEDEKEESDRNQYSEHGNWKRLSDFVERPDDALRSGSGRR
jgi:hypothetical protein